MGENRYQVKLLTTDGDGGREIYFFCLLVGVQFLDVCQKSTKLLVRQAGPDQRKKLYQSFNGTTNRITIMGKKCDCWAENKFRIQALLASLFAFEERTQPRLIKLNLHGH